MIAACVAVLLIVTYIPITSTFLPKALAKEGSYTGDQSSASSDTASKEAGDGNNSFDTIADYSDLDWPEMTWNSHAPLLRQVHGLMADVSSVN